MEQIKKVAIACQGGGSHTAFTAGALIKILSSYAKIQKQGRRIIGFSGTSGGGLCAALAWYGFNYSNAGKGVKALEAFWEENKTRDNLPFCLPPFTLAPLCYNATFMNKAVVNTMRNNDAHCLRFEYIPAWVQEEAQNALKNILNNLAEKGLIDFNKIKNGFNADSMASLYIGAVNIEQGSFEVFKNNDVTLEALLASAAVPPLFAPIQIKINHYWDGLYSQNPPISNFLDLIGPEKEKNLTRDEKLEFMKSNKALKPDEIWIIRINPKEKEISKIKTPHQKKDRQNELAGNLSLEQELASIKRMNALLDLFKDTIGEYYKPVTIKEITIDEIYLKNICNIELDYPSKLDRSPAFIDALIEHGKERADYFLKNKLTA